jgi:addiction module HigA family antidote
MREDLHRDDLHQVDWSDVSTGDRIGPVPPGDVLRLEFMQPLGLSARAVARDMGVPPNLITGILNGDRAITARTALLLAARFSTSAEFWMGLQTAHDLEIERHRTVRVA